MPNRSRTEKTPFLLALALVAGALLVLAGCGGDTSVASGGIGGTGKGTISGYGSVIINGESEYTIVEGETELTLDGEEVTQADLEAMGGNGIGLVASFTLADDADPQLLGGTALSVHVEHQLIGPVTTAGPLLAVLGQKVQVNANTVLVSDAVEPFDRTALEGLEAGAILRVSGYPIGNNHLLATRVEHVSAGVAEWKLIGSIYLPNPDLPTLFIGPQEVDFTGVIPADCGTGLMDGDFVDIRADASQNDPLDPAPLAGVTSVTCTTGGLSVPPGVGSGFLPALVEGVADNVAPPWFLVSGQLVMLTDDTKYRGGEAQHLMDGVHLQVRGKLDLGSGVLIAERVRFLMPTVRILGPMDSPGTQYKAGESITLLSIAAMITPDTQIAGNLETPSQVRVYGFVGGFDVVYATRIIASGATPTNTGVDLRGPVDDYSVIDSTLTILGVVVDLGIDTQLQGSTGGPLQPADFFAALDAVTFPDVPQVSAKAGTFDGGSTISDPASVRIAN